MTKLFENISEKNKEKLYQILKANTFYFVKDVNVLSNINKTNFIAIIEEGSANLLFTDYLGNETHLEELKKESIFGSLISNINTDEISCITKEKTKITFIEYDKITDNNNIKNNYYIIFIKNLLKILEEQINIKNERIEILTKKTIRDKLLQYFKILSIKKQSSTFNIPFSFIELANYLSIDRSAMTRELKNLKDEGFIKINKKRVTLLYK